MLFFCMKAQSPISWNVSNGVAIIRLTATPPTCSVGNVNLRGQIINYCGNGNAPNTRVRDSSGNQMYFGSGNFNINLPQGFYTIEPGLNCTYPPGNVKFTMRYSVDIQLGINDITVCDDSAKLSTIGTDNYFLAGNSTGTSTTSGYIPYWSIVSGGIGASITDVNAYNTTIASLPLGETVVRFAMVKTGCPDLNVETLTITRQSVPESGAIGNDQTVCTGAIPLLLVSIVDGIGDGAVSYIWEKSEDNVDWDVISGAIGSTYAPPALSATTYYRRTTVSMLNGVSCNSAQPTSIIKIDVVKCSCYKPPATVGNTLDTLYGITALGRAGTDDIDNWPIIRKGAWLALEAKTKGFVVNRLTTVEIAAIPYNNLIEGMMVYDITENCLKIYTTSDNGTTFSWKCFGTQTCPE